MSGGALWRVKPTTRIPFSKACRARLPPIRPRPTTPYSFLASVIVFPPFCCSFTYRLLSGFSQRYLPFLGPLDRPQDSSGGGTVAPLDLERQADELVLARLHLSEIEAFYNPDPGLEQSLVCLHTVLQEPSHGEVVDPDGQDLLGSEVARRLLRDVDEGLDESFLVPPTGRILCLE